MVEIFSVPHFHQLVGKQPLLFGHPVADPFIIASARVRGGCVVTEEAAQAEGRENPERVPTPVSARLRHLSIYTGAATSAAGLERARANSVAPNVSGFP